QVAMVHQKVGAMLLGRDRVRVRFRHPLHHFQVLQVHLKAARRALFGADFAGDYDGRFLRQVLDGLEQFLRQGGLHGHALHQAVTVAKNRERDLSGAAQVVQPAGYLDAFARVPGGFGDGDSWNRAHWFSSRSKISFTLSSGTVPGCSFSSSSSGYCASRLRSNRMAFFQSMVPPSLRKGKRWLSSFPPLSCTCVERMLSFIRLKAFSMPSFICACPRSKAWFNPMWVSSWNCSSRAALASSLGMFSSRISTPRCRAKMFRSSSAAKAASNLRRSNSSPATPMCWIRYRNGITSAISRARLISSTISRRRPFTGSVMETTACGPERPQISSLYRGACSACSLICESRNQ